MHTQYTSRKYVLWSKVIITLGATICCSAFYWLIKKTYTATSSNKILPVDEAHRVVNPLNGPVEKLNSADTEPTEVSSPDKEYILLLGFDRDPQNMGRTDTIMIVEARHTTKQIGVISIPRDLWVSVPGSKPRRINAVYRAGTRMLGTGGGFKLLKDIVRVQFGIEIDHTIAVNFAGFEKIIDLLGGITIDVKCPIEDRFLIPGAHSNYATLSLKAGKNRVDGKTALLFARSRHGRPDADRARRQQLVLSAIGDRVFQIEVLPQIFALWSEINKHVVMDLDLKTAWRLGKLAASIDVREIHGAVLTPPVITPHLTADGKQVVVLNKHSFHQLRSSLFTLKPLGTREKMKCPPADVSLHWRERLGRLNLK